MTYQILKSINPTIFRAYDIRGIVETELTSDAVYTIGLALGSEARDRGETTLIIGRDGRLSGPKLIKALTQGLLNSGCDVIDVGRVPTPVLYFATHTLSVRSGVILTGSHNPTNYNGLKMVLGGETLADGDIQHLYQRIQTGNFQIRDNGTYKTAEIIPNYIQRITQDIKLKRPLKIVIDCGNGITGLVAPSLFKALGCEVIELFCEIDGNFPNHHPDPSVAENLIDLMEAVTKFQADVGLAFDGDGDRLGVVTNVGEIIWPDRQLMLYAIDVLSRNLDATIIYDVKSTYHLEKIIKQYGGQPIMWKTGHSFMKNKLKESGSLLAGEMSGHIFFKERWYGFDDGLYTGARLLEILANNQHTAEQLFAGIPNSVNTPELKLPIAEAEKFIFMQKFQQHANFADAKITTIDGLRADFADGWGLIRPSNTSPYLILRFEAETHASLDKIKTLFRQQILNLNPHIELPF